MGDAEKRIRTPYATKSIDSKELMRWCRRGDSNPHELPHTPLKRARLPVPPLRLKLSDSDYSVLSQCEKSRSPGSLLHKKPSAHFGLVVGDAVPAGDWEVVGAAVACGVGVCTGEGCDSASVDCNTECEPLTPGKESIKAISMKPAAAPMVIFARMLAVPRGPNAVLERLLENRSPAPDLPGCRSITTTKTTHERMNSPYRV